MIDINLVSFGTPIPIAPPPPIWHFPVALTLWSLSIFLLLEAVSFSKWAAKNGAEVPNFRAGISLAWGLSGGILLYFYIHSHTFALANEVPANDPIGWLIAEAIGLVFFALRESDGISQALLFSSLPIGLLAVFKFTIAISMQRSIVPNTTEPLKSPVALVIGSAFSLLQLAGSIASLYAVLRS